MKFKKLFKEINDWQAKTFPCSTPLSKIKHLKLEIEELEDNLDEKLDIPPERKFEEYVLEKTEETISEYADCFILLFGSAFSYGLTFEDIKDIMKEKLEINKKREWGKPDENGVVEHIE